MASGAIGRRFDSCRAHQGLRVVVGAAGVTQVPQTIPKEATDTLSGLHSLLHLARHLQLACALSTNKSTPFALMRMWTFSWKIRCEPSVPRRVIVFVKPAFGLSSKLL